MTRQTLRYKHSVTILIGTAILSACSTLTFNKAQPEKYLAMDCEQLNLLAESYRTETQELLFEDVSELERRNEAPRNSGLRANARPYEVEQDRERRSVALARRQKGCS